MGGVVGSVAGAALGNLANFAMGALFGTRRDPDLQFCYTVEIDGITLGMFSEAGGIKWSMETENVKSGGNNDHEFYLLGRAKFDPLVLKRGFVAAEGMLFDMMKANYDLTSSAAPRHKVDVVVLKRQNNTGLSGLVGLGEIGRFSFPNCFVQEWSGPQFNAKTSDITIESITFRYDYVEFLPGGPLATALGAIGGAIGGKLGGAVGGKIGGAIGSAAGAAGGKALGI